MGIYANVDWGLGLGFGIGLGYWDSGLILGQGLIQKLLTGSGTTRILQHIRIFGGKSVRKLEKLANLWKNLQNVFEKIGKILIS